MHFELTTIRPGSVRHTYLADDAKLLKYLKARYRESEYEEAKRFVRETEGLSKIQLKDRMGRRTELRRLTGGW